MTRAGRPVALLNDVGDLDSDGDGKKQKNGEKWKNQQDRIYSWEREEWRTILKWLARKAGWIVLPFTKMGLTM